MPTPPIRSRRRSLPTGTVTFLFTDIEGSTLLLQRVGDRYPALLETHQELLRAAIADHGGIEVFTEGDAFFVVFESAFGAVSAAVAAQRALAGHSWPADGKIRVRMGIHTGAGRLGGDNYVGLDVHRASRIASVAHGGQLVVSAATASLIGPSLPADVRLTDLGTHRLKDLAATEHLYQLSIAGIRHEFPTLRSLDPAPSRLPMHLSTFIGREGELGRTIALLRETRLLTLTGPGGTGKTRLAVQAAHEIAHEYPDGAFFVPLASIRDPVRIPTAILEALDLHQSATGTDPRAHLVGYLRERAALLILDNFEHVIEAAPLVGEILAASPGSRVMVTSRAPLRIDGEQEMPVPPLEVPKTGEALGPDGLLGYSAVALFVERARSVRPSFALTTENAADVAALTMRLDGLPLAIELAAAKVRMLPPGSILSRLETRFLAGGARDLPERQRTLADTIRWSYDLLDDPAQRLFERLGAFTGGAFVEQILAVRETRGVTGDEADVWDALTTLVDQSLVLQRDALGEPRFRMFETIREYAAERLDHRADAEELRRRHAVAYLDVARRAQPELLGMRRAEWLERLAVEHANHTAALGWATAAPDPDIALGIVASLWRFWQMRGHLEGGAAAIDAALSLEGGDSSIRAKAFEAAGGVAYWRGNLAASTDYYQRSLALWHRLGDDSELANASYNLAYGTAVIEGFDAAAALLDEAEAIYARLGDRTGLGRIYWAWGNVWQLSGDFAKAAELCLKSLTCFDPEQDPFDVGWAEFVLGENLLRLGRLAETEDHLRSGLALFAEVGDLSAMGLYLAAFAEVAYRSGEPERAMRLLGAGERLRRETGADFVVADPTRSDFARPEAIALLDGDEKEAFEAGVTMTLDEAVAYALREN